MTFCGTCGCHAEIGPDRFWKHACRHGDKGHLHVVAFVVSESQRAQTFPWKTKEPATA